VASSRIQYTTLSSRPLTCAADGIQSHTLAGPHGPRAPPASLPNH
jgi:hypothetical protein